MNETVLDKDICETSGTLNFKDFMYRSIKRLFDLVCSIIGIIFLIPITIVVKVCYMLSGDFHSIFFTQKRLGRNGKEFKLYKFRTMIPNAEEKLVKILAKNPKLALEYKENKKLANDPRITKVGKLIRCCSIDELPQFLNIFIGQMTLIGNRPYLPGEKEDMGVYYNSVLLTKPGLTGYWQVSGRSDVSFNKRLQLEKYYSEHRSLKMDAQIFFKTFAVVLFKKGAK